MGQKAENVFLSLISNRGKIREASTSEQHNHVDFILRLPNNKEIKYEIKARKKLQRADKETTDEFIWIELVNVIGNVGWLFGSADKLAFEQENEFIVVDRERLADFVKKTCKPFEIVARATDALYKGYRRKGRQDHLTIILTSDIRAIADEIISKTILT
jgi:hypothetical protein